MQISLSTKPLSQITAPALVVLLLEDLVLPEEKLADKFFAGLIAKLRRSKDFTAEARTSSLVFSSSQISRVLLVGLGKRTELTLEKIREGVGAAVGELKKLPIAEAAVLLPSLPKVAAKDVAQAVSEAFILTNYEFSYYKAPLSKERPKLGSFEIVMPGGGAKAQVLAGITAGQILGEVVNTVRDLGNHPANVATPSHLAQHAQRIAKEGKNIKVKILHRSDIEKEKMGALLAVSKGSDEEPKFIILEYKGKKSAPTIALVGKGITFDSGGINIKPSEKMEEMKFDMAGAATVMGIIKIASELKLPLNLVGLIPATENLPSGKASKPGDIVRARSGKTIEIVNTDAEGRLVLADALDYAKKYQPALVMDFATLTGAIVVALGDDLIGAFTNKESLLPKLRAAATMTGEKIWSMPLEKSYEEFLKSDFADLRNIGTFRHGDAINAAVFLSKFTDYPWIHLDIAGVAWATREKPYRPKGATGVGVRLAIEFLKNFKK